MRENLFEAKVTLQNGVIISGPVVSNDRVEFVFTNHSSELDYWIAIKKNENGWYKSDGFSFPQPQEQIDELGSQIEGYLDSGN